MAIRVLAELDILEINSISYLLVTPILIGFIPFFLKQPSFIESSFKVTIFPLISVLLFLIIAVISKLEDLLCFIIIGSPYILFSIIVSLMLRAILKKQDDDVLKNALPIFMLPIVLGVIEKQVAKEKTKIYLSNEIIINCNDQVVWDNLLSVPDLSNVQEDDLFNYIGVPQPIKSTYDSITNIRLGYFENDIILNETVVQRVELKKLVFKIDLDKSHFENSKTLKHILKNRNVEFHTIQYELSPIGENQTKLKLSTKYAVHSNVPFYGQYWSNLIINDFETKLLKALKNILEKE